MIGCLLVSVGYSQWWSSGHAGPEAGVVWQWELHKQLLLLGPVGYYIELANYGGRLIKIAEIRNNSGYEITPNIAHGGARTEWGISLPRNNSGLSVRYISFMMLINYETPLISYWYYCSTEIIYIRTPIYRDAREKGFCPCQSIGPILASLKARENCGQSIDLTVLSYMGTTVTIVTARRNQLF